MSAMHLVAVQPWIQASDYASGSAFDRKLDTLGTLLRDARGRTRTRTAPCLVVFPEMLGTFLAMAGEDLRGITTVDGAFAYAARQHAGEVFRAAVRWRALDPSRALLLALGIRVRRLYVQAFSRFARVHGVTVVAGSALLPDIDAAAGLDARPRSGAVYNTSYLFNPAGQVMAATRKVNLVPGVEDTLGLSRGAARDVPVVRTDLGPVATLICYDGFSEPHTAHEPRWRAVAPRVAGRGARVLAQPAANPWPWFGPWVHNTPGESRQRKDQWRAEGLAGQLSALAGVRYMVTAQLVGTVLDARFEGASEILARQPDGTVTTLATARAASDHATSEEVLCVAVEGP